VEVTVNRFLLGSIGLVLSALAVPVSTLASGGDGDQNVVKHYGYTATDKFIECAKRGFGKNVAYSPALRAGPELADTPCPGDAAALRNLLKEKGISEFETADWVLLVPSVFVNAKPGDPYYQVRIQWKTFKVITDIHAAKLEDEGAPELSEAEAKAAGEAALKNARTPPVVPPSEPTSGDEVIIKLELAIRKVKLAANAPEAIIAVITQTDSFEGNARMIYEEIRDGKYHVVWDSPIFSAGTIELLDVNGDSWKEIVVTAQERGVRDSYSKLVIFDHEGRELTRQQACDPGGISGEVCPIGTNDEISFGPNESGPRQINAGEVYLFTNGIYVSEEKESDQTKVRRQAAQDNQLGLKLLRAGRFPEAGVKFSAAAVGDRSNPEYVNNLGFAEFKARQYDMCAELFREAIELDPTRAVAYLNLADALQEENARINRLEIGQAYAKYLELAPSSKGAPVVKKKLDDLPPLSPADRESFTFIDAVFSDLKGRKNLEQSRYAEALSAFLEVANHFPFNPKFLNDVAIVYCKTGKPQEGLVWLNKAIERNPQYAPAYVYRGDANSQLKRFAQAREAYGTYLQLDPESDRSIEVKKKLDALPPL
jgi:Flp pilus assembly protein TadD